MKDNMYPAPSRTVKTISASKTTVAPKASAKTKAAPLVQKSRCASCGRGR